MTASVRAICRVVLTSLSSKTCTQPPELRPIRFSIIDFHVLNRQRRLVIGETRTGATHLPARASCACNGERRPSHSQSVEDSRTLVTPARFAPPYVWISFFRSFSEPGRGTQDLCSVFTIATHKKTIIQGLRPVRCLPTVPKNRAGRTKCRNGASEIFFFYALCFPGNRVKACEEAIV